METMPLSFGVLMGYLHRAISAIPDPRQASQPAIPNSEPQSWAAVDRLPALLRSRPRMELRARVGSPDRTKIWKS
jgi:hypothetical protein